MTKDEQNHAKTLSFKHTTWGDNPQEGEMNGHEEDWTKVPWTWTELEGKEKQAAEDPSCQYSSLIEGVHEAEEDGNAVV